MEANKEIDTRGLNCPLPILKAKKALADMASGETLKVVATDPGSVRDFQAFARQTGNELIDQRTVGDEFIHWLRRQKVFAYTYEGRRYDCGSKEGFLQANVELGLSHPEVGESFREYLKSLDI